VGKRRSVWGNSVGFVAIPLKSVQSLRYPLRRREGKKEKRKRRRRGEGVLALVAFRCNPRHSQEFRWREEKKGKERRKDYHLQIFRLYRAFISLLQGGGRGKGRKRERIAAGSFQCCNACYFFTSSRGKERGRKGGGGERKDSVIWR